MTEPGEEEVWELQDRRMVERSIDAMTEEDNGYWERALDDFPGGM